MTQLAFEFEEVWLHTALKDHIDDLFVSVEAQRRMIEHQISLPEVMSLLRSGTVVESEKYEIGAKLIVVGRNCDEEELWAHVHIETNLVRIEILDVRKLNLG